MSIIVGQCLLRRDKGTNPASGSSCRVLNSATLFSYPILIGQGYMRLFSVSIVVGQCLLRRDKGIHTSKFGELMLHRSEIDRVLTAYQINSPATTWGCGQDH